MRQDLAASAVSRTYFEAGAAAVGAFPPNAIGIHGLQPTEAMPTKTFINRLPVDIQLIQPTDEPFLVLERVACQALMALVQFLPQQGLCFHDSPPI